MAGVHQATKDKDSGAIIHHHGEAPEQAKDAPATGHQASQLTENGKPGPIVHHHGPVEEKAAPKKKAKPAEEAAS